MKSWPEVQLASTARIVSWAQDQRWAQAMAQCQQDAQWHAEGDVWTHTLMVVAQIETLPEWPSLDRSSQLALLFTALLHDSGKPATTHIDEPTGRTRSPKHALVGAGIARSVLRDLGCELRLREKIVGLVRFHGRPAFVLEKPDPAHEVIQLSWLVDNRLLYLFALADSRGRRTSDTVRAEENIHLWKLVADENQCFDQPYGFANDHARFLFYRHALSSLHYVPREDFSCIVTLMSGLPGSGKDTWLNQNRPELSVVSLDDLRDELDIEATGNQGRVIQAARERCREHLRARTAFAFNATNIVAQTRRQWIDLFANYGARIEVVYLEPPLPMILERNERREQRVPPSVIHRLLEKTEPPTFAEAHSVSLVGEPALVHGSTTGS
jgi:putative nucleotidyltransferase with HDIG domain